MSRRRHLAAQLRDRGATVYAAARNPASVDLKDVTPVALDGIAAGEAEIVADETSKRILAALSSGVRGRYPQFA